MHDGEGFSSILGVPWLKFKAVVEIVSSQESVRNSWLLRFLRSLAAVGVTEIVNSPYDMVTYHW